MIGVVRDLPKPFCIQLFNSIWAWPSFGDNGSTCKSVGSHVAPFFKPTCSSLKMAKSSLVGLQEGQSGVPGDTTGERRLGGSSKKKKLIPHIIHT